MVKLNDYAKPGILKLKGCEQSHASHQDENLVKQTQNLPLVEENSTYRQEILAIRDQLQHFDNQLEHDKHRFPLNSWFNEQYLGETSSYGCVGQNQMEPTSSISVKGLQPSQPKLNKCTSTTVGEATSINNDVNHLHEWTPCQFLPKTQTSPIATAVISTPMKHSGRLKKKPIEALDTSVSRSILKKVKTTGSSACQSMEVLNDVVTSSATNLKEEEEKLLSATIEGQVWAATKRLEKEEEISILEKDLLRKKLSQITTRCGIASIGNDVEGCISTCVEDRLRKLIPNLIRLSKQRVDIEKSRHQCVVTSDVRNQMLSMYQKAKEDYANQHPRTVEKISELSDLSDGSQLISAANSSARSAIGMDDVCAKWQLMAEEARQKGETGTSTGNMNNVKSPAVKPDPKINRSITINDVIAALEGEPHMSKSTLLYRLYMRKK